MTASWIVYCLLTSALLAVAAVAAERATRLWAQGGRWVWLAALHVSLALATLPLLPAAQPSAIGAGWVESALPPLPRPTPTAEPVGARGLEPVVAGSRRPTVDGVLRVSWAVSAALAALALLVSFAGLSRRRRQWRRAIVDGTEVLVSEDLGPAVIGFLRGRIVLPRWAFEAGEATRSLILAHEREHLRAGDQRLLGLSLAVWVLMAWNPMTWWQLRRLRTAIELDCDARVLAAGADKRSYGALLLQISRAPAGVPAFVTALGEPTTNLERRIRAMSRKRQSYRGPLTTVAALVAVALVALACEMPRPSLFDRSEPEAQPIELSVVGTSEWRPRPEFAKQLREVIQARHPRLYSRGQKGGEALWFVLDREDRIIDSWIGPRYTEQRWRDFKSERRFSPALSLVPTLFDVPDRTGRPIFIVWAKPIKLWELDGAPRREIVQRIQAFLERRSPELIRGTIPPGHAIWAVDHNGGKEENFLRDVEIWIAPYIADRKAQWDALRTHIPDSVDVAPVNFTTRDGAGKQVPVIYGIETVW